MSWRSVNKLRLNSCKKSFTQYGGIILEFFTGSLGFRHPQSFAIIRQFFGQLEGAAPNEGRMQCEGKMLTDTSFMLIPIAIVASYIIHLQVLLVVFLLHFYLFHRGLSGPKGLYQLGCPPVKSVQVAFAFGFTFARGVTVQMFCI